MFDVFGVFVCIVGVLVIIVCYVRIRNIWDIVVRDGWVLGVCEYDWYSWVD